MTALAAVSPTTGSCVQNVVADVHLTLQTLSRAACTFWTLIKAVQHAHAGHGRGGTETGNMTRGHIKISSQGPGRTQRSASYAQLRVACLFSASTMFSSRNCHRRCRTDDRESATVPA
jgi:hypothetical protein